MGRVKPTGSVPGWPSQLPSLTPNENSPLLRTVFVRELFSGNGRSALDLQVGSVGDQHAIARVAVAWNLHEGNRQLLRLNVQLFLEHFGDTLHRAPLLLDRPPFQQGDLYVCHKSLPPSQPSENQTADPSTRSPRRPRSGWLRQFTSPARIRRRNNSARSAP